MGIFNKIIKSIKKSIKDETDKDIDNIFLIKTI